jgi:hypothetical protein
MTKIRAKKAEKKIVASAKEETPAAVSVLAEPERVLHVAPIEVVHEEVAVKTPVVEERRTISNEERRRLIALAAYYRAQQVGFGKTNPVDDWLLAEREVDAMMENGNAS